MTTPIDQQLEREAEEYVLGECYAVATPEHTALLLQDRIAKGRIIDFLAGAAAERRRVLEAIDKARQRTTPRWTEHGNGNTTFAADKWILLRDLEAICGEGE